MSAALIDGKAIAAELRAALTSRVAAFAAAHQSPPCLAVILVGDDPASAVYVRNKAMACAQVGITSHEIRLPATTSLGELLAQISQHNDDPQVDGILVQLPLPAGLDAAAVIAAIDPAKDVDGFHVVNAGRLALGLPGLVPCTPLGCVLLLQRTLGDLAGKHAVILGRSHIVGKPLAQLLLQANCTVTLCHSHTRALAEETRRADILVAAIGRPEYVKGDWIKPGATVIDVGINRITRDGRTLLVGDVDFASAQPVAGHMTPVPGGVGPMTIACLLENTLTAALARRSHA